MHAFVVDYALVTGSLAGIKRVLTVLLEGYYRITILVPGYHIPIFILPYYRITITTVSYGNYCSTV